MKNLFMKELKLALHPTAAVFMLLSAMLLIPSYPYYVVFFYTGLGIFFTCLNGRENKDVFYTCLLPVSKSDAVKARFMLAVALEIAQMVVCIPFALIRRGMPIDPNPVGMEANIAFFGIGFVLYGLFNMVFFGIYYKNVQKVGTSFISASIAVFVFIMIAEVLAHAVPFFRDRLDNFDPQYIPQRIIVLAVGIVIFAVMTMIAYKKAVADFEKQDL